MHYEHMYTTVFTTHFLCSYNAINAVSYNNKMFNDFRHFLFDFLYLLSFISSFSERRTTEGHQLMLHEVHKMQDGWIDRRRDA